MSQHEQTAAQTTQQHAEYLGADTCKTCHEELYQKNFETTAHFKTTLGNGHGCESCHGPGSAHVQADGDVTKIISFKSLSKQQANARCLSCHGENLEQRHFSSSSHSTAKLAASIVIHRIMPKRHSICWSRNSLSSATNATLLPKVILPNLIAIA